LVQTAGSVENRALLRDPHSGVNVALMQGGIVTAGDSSQLESLGTVFYEPLWWFRQRDNVKVGVEGTLLHGSAAGRSQPPASTFM
jgi:hypothetical protein